MAPARRSAAPRTGWNGCSEARCRLVSMSGGSARRLFAACGFLAAAFPASFGADAVAWTLREPWPSQAELAGIAAQEVSFPSSSPFAPAQAGPNAEPTTALGYLYLPRPPARGAPA